MNGRESLCASLSWIAVCLCGIVLVAALTYWTIAKLWGAL